MDPIKSCLLAAVLALGCARGPTTTAKPSDPVTIDLDFKNAPIHDVMRAIATGARVNLSVDPDVEGTISIQVHAAPWREVLEGIARDHALRIEKTGKLFRISNAATPPSPPKEYTGAPIEVDFREMPIRMAMQTFVDFAKVKIVVDGDVQAAVTLHLRGVPWDLALDHLARKYELQVMRDGDAIRIARNH